MTPTTENNQWKLLPNGKMEKLLIYSTVVGCTSLISALLMWWFAS